jgi:uncharacterized damage-inducible protein DinB
MDTAYIGRNQDAARRLAELVARLSTSDLLTALSGGWTVKAALAHLAFWDRYAAALLERWAAEGFRPVASSPDHVNAAALPGWLELPEEYVRREVVAAAEAVDQRVAAVTPALAQAIADGGRARMLDRSRHRQEHIDQILAAING